MRPTGLAAALLAAATLVRVESDPAAPTPPAAVAGCTSVCDCALRALHACAEGEYTGDQSASDAEWCRMWVAADGLADAKECE